MDENVIKKFENDSHKQREIYNLTDNWFNTFELEIIEESLLMSYDTELKREINQKIRAIHLLTSGNLYSENSLINFESSEEDIIKYKNKEIYNLSNKILIKYRKIFEKIYSLFIVNFSIEWEKNIVKILSLSGLIKEKKKKKKNNYQEIYKLIDNNLKLLSKSKVYKDIKKIRSLANDIKHKHLDNELILNNFFQTLLDIQNNIIKDHEVYMRTLWNERNNIKVEKELSIGYILKNLHSNINENWISKEFSFNMKREISVEYKGTLGIFIVFSDEEEEEVRKNPEIHFKF